MYIYEVMFVAEGLGLELHKSYESTMICIKISSSIVKTQFWTLKIHLSDCWTVWNDVAVWLRAFRPTPYGFNINFETGFAGLPSTTRALLLPKSITILKSVASGSFFAV